MRVKALGSMGSYGVRGKALEFRGVSGGGGRNTGEGLRSASRWYQPGIIVLVPLALVVGGAGAMVVGVVGGVSDAVLVVGSAALVCAGWGRFFGASLAAARVCVGIAEADDGSPLHEKIEQGRWRDVDVIIGGFRRDGVSAESANPALRTGIAPGRCGVVEEHGIGQCTCWP